jgi:hypothetical protein
VIPEQSEPLYEYDLAAILCLKNQYGESNYIYDKVEKVFGIKRARQVTKTDTGSDRAVKKHDYKIQGDI